MSAFTNIVKGALATVQTVAGDPITYATADKTATLTATRGKTSIESRSADFVSLSHESRDWLIEAEEFRRELEIDEPDVGHVITDGQGQFEVMEQSDGECFRYVDPDRTWFRIHTKQVV